MSASVKVVLWSAVAVLWLNVFLCRQCEAASFVPAVTIKQSDDENSGAELSTSTKPPTVNPKSQSTPNIEDAAFWRDVGLKQLRRILDTAGKSTDKSHLQKARNIIIFVGDGMGLTTITAGRIYKGQQLQQGNSENEMLAFDAFPHTGIAKTYNVDNQVSDSASTATAIFTGVKTRNRAIGVDMTRSELNSTQGRVPSIMDWALELGKRTGIVTTTRITHATPAATYAGSNHRDWECDTEVPIELRVGVGVHEHIDIARQLIEKAPGNRMNVIMGGGRSPMGALDPNEVNTVKFSGNTESICSRGDGRNLTDEWLQLDGEGGNRRFVQNRDDLMKLDVKNVEHLLGLFRNNHITYSIARQEGEPTLSEMVEKAIGILERPQSKGFVLMVEGGRIDQAHHQNYARAAMQEVFELDKAVEMAVRMTDDKETLIIVTADHSHAVTLNGYAKRGNDILGFASKTDDTFQYETLTYANGPGYHDHFNLNLTQVNETKLWMDTYRLSSDQKRLEPTYRHLATLPLTDETHGGEDVVVFATGPGSSLIRGVFEQNYLAYAMSYAGCMGPAKDVDETCKEFLDASAGTNSFTDDYRTFVRSILTSVVIFFIQFYIL